MDLCGSLPVKSKGGRRYILTFTDDVSKCSTIKFLLEKSQAKGAIMAITRQLENQLEARVKEFRTDRGREFLNKELAQFCSEKGIIHQTTNLYTPQKNGVAERLNRVLLGKARAMPQDAGHPEKLWAEAVFTANHVQNRTLSRSHGKTPLEVLTDEKPLVSHLRVFGSVCYAHVPVPKRKKLDAVAKKGVFLGYEPHTKGYWILEPDGSIQVSRDVIFQEITNKSEDKLLSTSPQEAGEEDVMSKMGEAEGGGLDELGGARDLSRVSPLDSPHAGATPMGEASVRDDPEPEGEPKAVTPPAALRCFNP
jgi:hypothetical protein